MTDTITLTGLVATTPRHVVTTEGLTISSFRLASAQRRFDKAQERWIDVDTNWYTITAFRQLAVNCAGSIRKGDRVLVTGRLKIREWENGERTGTTIDIEADAIGHDLSWGTSAFSRIISSHRGSTSTAELAAESTSSSESWAPGSSMEDHDGLAEQGLIGGTDRDRSDDQSRIDEDAAALPF